ncbi:b561 and DOMON domain-containing protein [Seminavis robusta]|uniref:B561 and DOMON domain-containing protein n=1 Tax=Seminavis robusta TaxID=568900 RepID=A0A9N8HW84_9STRA|nr:b561 and DOMON domain-containing protein [Seminavis robusta]|eukprot:Sro2559_g331270.1 b561 and DOMON domain-containing protein (410) ;mRNA; r:6725-7954
MSASLSLSKSAIDVEDTKLQQQAAAEDEICFIGYVLDQYCIDRGTLLDNYQIESLLEPQRHSIHCLVDVARCVHSGFQMLEEPTGIGDNADRYCRAFQLDDYGNELMLQFARSTGEQGYCSTCTGPPGAPSRGFRATVYGKIMPQSTSPPVLQVTRVESIRNGCQGLAPYLPPAESLSCESGSFLPFVAAHGSLMLISWGFLIPLGVISARLLKQFPHHSTLWFHVHRVVQPLGILTGLAGWITALAGPFNILGSGVYDAQFAHATLGTIVMGLGLLQPINAFLRPHKQSNDDIVDNLPDDSSLKKRRHWELLHKTIGYLSTLFGMVNCFIGMALSGKYQDKFFNSIVGLWVSLAFYGIALIAYRWYVACTNSSMEPATSDEQDIIDQVAADPIEIEIDTDDCIEHQAG